MKPVDLVELVALVEEDPASFQYALHKLINEGYDHTYPYDDCGRFVNPARFSLKLARTCHGVDSKQAHEAAGVLAMLTQSEDDFWEALRLARLYPAFDGLWTVGWAAVNLVVLLSQKAGADPSKIVELLQESLEWAFSYGDFDCLVHLETDEDLRLVKKAVEHTGNGDRLRKLLELSVRRAYPNQVIVLTPDWKWVSSKGVA